MAYNLIADAEKQTEKAKDLARARQSLIEELDAINVYEERAQATTDEKLKKTLLHNGHEEKEHAAMLIEYLRNNDVAFDKMFEEHD
ncbi:ferritin [Candidatus Roizmanbacteria bacterium CG_4_10_14_0_8_um_filter_39_9]|jgi:hypothetical protein|uniref:Ferritin n=1 Tax=Candidatus Roizmanbacteria bacterium CG_4_10_14_0_8_um_filter_39_9 TaxID=1974829 RepID=A0A2M7QD55_9BACT|nr:MAG: ferritin [Candidatus Roizmanbacteria bacterium CG_4_10_14_0_8_um_filter_39_9]